MTETPPSPEEDAPEQPAARPIADVDTVEALVRQQLSTALGGPRGVIEAAVPTAVFTIAYVVSDDLKLSLILAAALAGVALLVRLVQRSTVQFVLNAAFGIGIGAAFALRASGGDDKDDGALAYFLPGILYNTAYAVVLVLTVLIRWPLIGFMVGAVTGEPTAWRSDPAMVKLCQRLTLLLAAPCIIRVAVQYPLYEAGEVGMLGTAKVLMGWPLQVGALALMAALLARGRTPLVPSRTD
ncbi:MAG TPA: DUF3159 domain-containing protein [Sporichthya sp.]|nr:DUF3159 domain-containing protein [Sporichthya sp.]